MSADIEREAERILEMGAATKERVIWRSCSAHCVCFQEVSLTPTFGVDRPDRDDSDVLTTCRL